MGTILVPFWLVDLGLTWFDQNCFSTFAPTCWFFKPPLDQPWLHPMSQHLGMLYALPLQWQGFRMPIRCRSQGCLVKGRAMPKNVHFHGENDGKIMTSWCSLVSTCFNCSYPVKHWRGVLTTGRMWAWPWNPFSALLRTRNTMPLSRTGSVTSSKAPAVCTNGVPAIMACSQLLQNRSVESERNNEFPTEFLFRPPQLLMLATSNS